MDSHANLYFAIMLTVLLTLSALILFAQSRRQ
jgi:hypothetical protein